MIKDSTYRLIVNRNIHPRQNIRRWILAIWSPIPTNTLKRFEKVKKPPSVIN